MLNQLTLRNLRLVRRTLDFRLITRSCSQSQNTSPNHKKTSFKSKKNQTRNFDRQKPKTQQFRERATGQKEQFRNFDRQKPKETQHFSDKKTGQKNQAQQHKAPIANVYKAVLHSLQLSLPNSIVKYFQSKFRVEIYQSAQSIRLLGKRGDVETAVDTLERWLAGARIVDMEVKLAAGGYGAIHRTYPGAHVVDVPKSKRVILLGNHSECQKAEAHLQEISRLCLGFGPSSPGIVRDAVQILREGKETHIRVLHTGNAAPFFTNSNSGHTLRTTIVKGYHNVTLVNSDGNHLVVSGNKDEVDRVIARLKHFLENVIEMRLGEYVTPITMSKMFQERAKKIRVAYDFETGVLLMQNAFGEEKGDGAVELKSKIDALLDQTEVMEVEERFVSSIIGMNGKQIANLEAHSGCAMSLFKKVRGKIFLQSPSPEARFRARKLVEEYIGNVEFVPVSTIVGRVLRSEGLKRVSQIESDHRVSLSFWDDGGTQIAIHGDLESRRKARVEIELLMEKESEIIEVGHKIHSVIGTKGATIREIIASSGCQTITDKNSMSIILFGTKEQVEKAKAHIEGILKQSLVILSGTNLPFITGATGARIQKMRKSTGATIMNDSNGVITIFGTTDQAVQARDAVNKILDTVRAIPIKGKEALFLAQDAQHLLDIKSRSDINQIFVAEGEVRMWSESAKKLDDACAQVYDILKNTEEIHLPYVLPLLLTLGPGGRDIDKIRQQARKALILANSENETMYIYGQNADDRQEAKTSIQAARKAIEEVDLSVYNDLLRGAEAIDDIDISN